jgi:hypothetical protein
MPAARKLSSFTPPTQQSAIVLSTTTVGTRLIPSSFARFTLLSCFMSWMVITHEEQAIRFTSATASSQQTQPAVKTSTLRF